MIDYTYLINVADYMPDEEVDIPIITVDTGLWDFGE